MGGPASGGSGAIDIPWLPGLLGLFHFHVKAELIMHRDTLTYDWLTMYVVSYLSLSFMCVCVCYLPKPRNHMSLKNANCKIECYN